MGLCNPSYQSCQACPPDYTPFYAMFLMGILAAMGYAFDIVTF